MVGWLVRRLGNRSLLGLCARHVGNSPCVVSVTALLCFLSLFVAIRRPLVFGYG